MKTSTKTRFLIISVIGTATSFYHVRNDAHLIVVLVIIFIFGVTLSIQFTTNNPFNLNKTLMHSTPDKNSKDLNKTNESILPDPEITLQTKILEPTLINNNKQSINPHDLNSTMLRMKLLPPSSSSSSSSFQHRTLKIKSLFIFVHKILLKSNPWMLFVIAILFVIKKK